MAEVVPAAPRETGVTTLINCEHSYCIEKSSALKAPGGAAGLWDVLGEGWDTAAVTPAAISGARLCCEGGARVTRGSASSWHGRRGMLGKRAAVASGAGQLALASPHIQLRDALVLFPIFWGNLMPETFLLRAGQNLWRSQESANLLRLVFSHFGHWERAASSWRTGM